jgi:hypothetical protein
VTSTARELPIVELATPAAGLSVQRISLDFTMFPAVSTAGGRMGRRSRAAPRQLLLVSDGGDWNPSIT